MTKYKCCTNGACRGYYEKIKYIKGNDYCTKCGSRTNFVCKSKKCDTLIAKNDGAYCYRCIEIINQKKQSRKDAMNKVGKAVGSGVAVIGEAVVDVAVKKAPRVVDGIIDKVVKK